MVSRLRENGMKHPLLALLIGLAVFFTVPQARSETKSPPALTGLKVAIDVGHSLSKLGALSARGRGEFLFNQSTARVIADGLKAAGADVKIINEKGNITGLVERTQEAEKWNADVFLSIHHDSVNDKYLETWEVEGKPQQYCDRFSGYCVLCSEKNLRAAESRAVAIELGSAMLNAGFKPAPHHHEAIKGENRPWIDQRTGVYEYTDLVVAKSGKLPSMLLECGVIVNRDEEMLVQTKEYQQRIAGAVAAALAAARAKELIGTPPPMPKGPAGSLLDVTATPSKPEPESDSKRERGLKRLLQK